MRKRPKTEPAGLRHDGAPGTDPARGESERFAQLTINALSAHIAILDERGVILQVNDAWRAFADGNGLSVPNYAVGMNYLAVTEKAADSDAAAAHVAGCLRGAITGRQPVFVAEYACHGPAEQRWFEVRITRFIDRDRAYVVVAHENITRRRLSEQQLARDSSSLARQYRRQSALAQMELAINKPDQLKDVLHRIVHEVGELLPSSGGASILLWDSLVDRFVVSASSVPDQPQQFAATRVRDQGGATRWIVEHSQPHVVPDVRNDPFGANQMLDEYDLRAYAGLPIRTGGKSIGVLYALSREPREYTSQDMDFLTDLAERAAVAIHNVQLAESLRNANQRLRDQHDELAARNRNLDEFAFVASHDLQEPLRKIRSFGQRLRSRFATELPNRGREYLERMENAACRMQQLIEDLLSLSRIASHITSPEGVDLNVIIAEVIGDLESSRESVGGRIESDDLPTIRGDPVQMRRLFQNLIGNALKFHRPGVAPVIRVRHNRDAREDLCRIAIEDNGIGFEQAHAERIFQMFQRLHGRDAFEGTGMGLAICRRIIDVHGGHISAQGRPGQGSVFTIELPVAPPVSPGPNSKN